jgi:hypothetical protein
MDNLISLEKKLSTYVSDSGRIKNVSDDTISQKWIGLS